MDASREGARVEKVATLGRVLAPLEISEAAANRRTVSAFAIVTSAVTVVFLNGITPRYGVAIFAAIGNMVVAIAAASVGQVQVEGSYGLLNYGQAVYSQPVESRVLQVGETATKSGIATLYTSPRENGRRRAGFQDGLRTREGLSVSV